MAKLTSILLIIFLSFSSYADSICQSILETDLAQAYIAAFEEQAPGPKSRERAESLANSTYLRQKEYGFDNRRPTADEFFKTLRDNFEEDTSNSDPLGSADSRGFHLLVFGELLANNPELPKKRILKWYVNHKHFIDEHAEEVVLRLLSIWAPYVSDKKLISIFQKRLERLYAEFDPQQLNDTYHVEYLVDVLPYLAKRFSDNPEALSPIYRLLGRGLWMRTLDNFSYRKIPSGMKDRMKAEGAKTNKAIVLDGIGKVPYGVSKNKCCDDAEPLFFAQLHSSNYEKNIPVVYKGELIGLRKTEGEATMLALRNVIDSNGKIVLLKGGIYQVDPESHKKIRAIEKILSRNPGFIPFETNELSVLGMRFIQAVEYYNDFNYETTEITRRAINSRITRYINWYLSQR